MTEAGANDSTGRTREENAAFIIEQVRCSVWTMAMTDKVGNCIYCGGPVVLSKGEGDHVIPDALGRFANQFIFRRICRTCNQLVGRCEERLLRCAPEAFVRRIVQPAVTRNQRGTSWVGANGVAPPKFTINREDHQELDRVSTVNPRNTEAIDQLVIVDKERGEQHIRLVPEMIAIQLRARIAAVAPSPAGNIYLHCDEGVFHRYTVLLRETYPEGSLTERESDEAGVR